MNLFTYDKPLYKITKPIRLIELFAGYGSQSLALKYLGIEHENYKVVEFDKYAIQSYNEIHDTDFPLLDITEIKGKDLEIKDTDKYEYIMTYSFPCQDLSLAGKGAGMSVGTRSGLLWEVERLLNEVEELPQILLMENVPQVIGKKNIEHFSKWVEFLESKGYSNFHQNLIATDYGIPQTRNRTFMISILGDYNYDFPQPKPLKLKLKDLLEKEVDEKYYLSNRATDNFILTKDTENYIEWKEKGKLDIDCRAFKEDKVMSTIMTTPKNKAVLKIPEATKKGYAIAHDGNGVYINRPHQKRGCVQKGKIQTLKTSGDDVGVVVNPNIKNINDENKTFSTLGTNCGSSTSAGGGVVKTNLRIRKLTPKECFRLMGVKDEDYDKLTCSNAQKYKQAGNSIVINVLMAIFKELI